VSILHAAVAFSQGVYWLKASGELQQLGNSPFLFAPIDAHIASIGASYFFYDCIAMVVSYNTMKRGFFWTIMVHHGIFVAAYLSTLVRTHSKGMSLTSAGALIWSHRIVRDISVHSYSLAVPDCCKCS
jgi:hypothetical protein